MIVTKNKAPTVELNLDPASMRTHMQPGSSVRFEMLVYDTFVFVLRTDVVSDAYVRAGYVAA